MARAELEAGHTNAPPVSRFALRGRHLLLAYFKAHGWGLPDPEQSAADALGHVVAKLNHFDADKGNFEAWVMTIARNRLRSELRMLPRDEQPPRTPGSALSSLTAHQKARLLDVLDEFAERERDLLRLIFLQGMNSAEAGTELGISHENARKLKTRLIERLNRTLE
jgi:RNA polymerase sigma factor (sigma-70 family)